ncbi:Hypothetical predicted protein [Mytilus galloprovincialis]|uniref:Uncharacterized protein n=1 Tax=Mytilus galloprovincialis TaxID=29158 RepID=A0A8B6BPD7_MYTGA|nr:Hypothetical predicted protein [Mytilus galloprovincialis]
MIVLDTDLKPQYNKPKPRKIYVYKKAKWEEIKADIIKFGADIINSITPLLKISGPTLKTRKKKIRGKHKLIQIAKHTGKPEDWAKFKQHKRDTQKAGRQAHWQYVNTILDAALAKAGTSEEWAYFESRWSAYVETTKIAGRDKVVQLLECCDEQLRKGLTRSAGGSLTNKSVQEVLAAIKKLAVREENTMVARVTLHNMRQDRDEPVRSFCARLRGQAGVCKFFIQCPTCNTHVNYTDTIIRDVLARGISDPEIQLDLLGDKNQDMTLEEVTQFVEAKDSGKRSASRLLDSQTVQAASSSY